MKKLIALCLAVLMLLSLAACGGSAPASSGDAPASSETAAASSEAAAPGSDKTPVTLQCSFVETEWLDAWEKQIKPEFEKEYPWITLEAVAVGGSELEYHTAHAASNDLPPVMQTDVGGLYFQLVDEGKLLDIRSYDAAENVPQASLDAYTYHDVCYGIPQGNAYSALYLNMAILEQAGWTEAPKDWDEFIQCCRDLQEKTDTGVITVAGNPVTTTPGWMPFEAILLNAYPDELGGGKFEELSKKGELNLTDYPKAIERFDELASYMMTGSSQNGDDDVIAIMTDGQCAMAIAGNWMAASIVGGIEEYNGGDPAKARMTPIPFNDPGKTVYIASTPESAIGLAKVDDPNVAEARDIFFNWMFEPEHFKYLQNACGTFPVLTNMTSDQLVFPEAVKVFKTEADSCSPFFMTFNEYTANVLAEGLSLFDDVFSGNMDAQTAFEKLTEQLKADPFGEG